MSADPFAVLGLPARPDLTDDDVRSAWRRIAAATHPDLPGGGDPARYAAASAAYAELRTRDGRGEALADRGFRGQRPATEAAGRPDATPEPDAAPGRAATAAPPGRAASGLVWRIRRGRPAVLVLRVLIASGICGAAFGIIGTQPASAGLATGVLTWLLLTARHDLMPPLR